MATPRVARAGARFARSATAPTTRCRAAARPAASRRSRPSAPATSVAHDLAVRHHRDDDVAAPPRASAGERAAPRAGQASRRASSATARRDVEQRQRVAGGGEVRRHRPAHDAEADEADARARCHDVQGYESRSGRRRRRMQQTLRAAPRGDDTLFAGRDPLADDDRMTPSLLAPLRRGLRARLAGAPAASAQTDPDDVELGRRRPTR